MSRSKKITEYNIAMIFAFSTLFGAIGFLLATFLYMPSIMNLSVWDGLLLMQPMFIIVMTFGILSIALSSYATALKNKKR